jgi:hypothetical protein
MDFLTNLFSKKQKGVTMNEIEAKRLFQKTFGMIPLNYIGTLDVNALGQWCAKNDTDFDWDNGTYKGEEISLSEYVETKYGKNVSDALDILLELGSGSFLGQ